jgi:CheY-like chemotaxis protein
MGVHDSGQCACISLVHARRGAYDEGVKGENKLHALCVARHEYIADHFCRFFAQLGLETKAVVGMEQALEISRASAPDIVLCDYELLSTIPIEVWERDDLLSRTAVIGVSLTRRPNEMHLLDVNGIAGFLYLPTLDHAAARRILSAAAMSARAEYRPPSMVGREDQVVLPA